MLHSAGSHSIGVDATVPLIKGVASFRITSTFLVWWMIFNQLEQIEKTITSGMAVRLFQYHNSCRCGIVL